jgi:hypothetical protein
MKYVTRIGGTHIVECNGVNHQVNEVVNEEGTPRITVTRYQHGNTRINKDFTVQTINYAGNVHLAEIVLAIEIVRFVLQNTK